MYIKWAYVKMENDMKDRTKQYVVRLQQGDEGAFQDLYDLYYKKAYYIALKISNFCDADAQDIAQETFMEIHRSIKNLRDPLYFKTWMTRIIVSKCSHKFRANKDMFVEPDVLFKMERHQESRNYMIPGNEINNMSDKEILLHLMEQLKPKQKEVIVLQYFQNLSMQEIADVLDVPMGTVKTRAMYARNDLAEKVRQYEKVEGRKLGFQAESLGAILVAALLQDFQGHMALKSFSLLSFLKTKVPLGSQASQVIMAVGIATIGVTASVGAYQFYQENQREQAPQQLNNNIIHDVDRKEAFKPVLYEDVEVANCRDAYYTLKEWAQNPKQIKLLSSSDKSIVLPIYEELKRYQGVYWEKLVKEKWVETFDSL